MSKVYPTDSRLNFILCEDVRQEQGNKVSLMGVLTGGDMILPPDAELPVAIGSLSLFFQFTDGEGYFEQRYEFLSPDSVEPQKRDGKSFTKQLGTPSNSFITFQPFFIPAIGTYVFRIYLDEQMYERTFEVKKQLEVTKN